MPSPLGRPRWLLAALLVGLTTFAPASRPSRAGATVPLRAAAASPVIDTIAGGPGQGPATRVRMNPREMTARNGILYVVDKGTQQDSIVRAIELSTGRSWVVAGGGETLRDGIGEGRPATTIALIDVTDVAVDEDGNVFIGENGTRRVRKVGSDGRIVTVAGNGVPIPGTDPYDERISGRATALPLSGVVAIALDDSGNLLIGTPLSVILRVDRNGRMTPVAGGGPDHRSSVATETVLYGVSDIVADGSGGFLITENNGNSVRRVDANGMVSQMCCDLGQGHHVISPEALAVGEAGRIYFLGQGRVLRRDPDGTVAVVAGGEHGDGSIENGDLATEADFNQPSGVAWAEGRLYVADTWNHRIWVIGPDGRISTFAGKADDRSGLDGAPATDVQLGAPEHISGDAAGNLFLTDNGSLFRLDSTGVLQVLNDNAFDGGVPSIPAGVAADGAGGAYFTDNGHVRHVDRHGNLRTVAGGPDAGYSGDGGPASQARFGFTFEWERVPGGLVLDSRGRLFIADTGNHVVRMIDEDGNIHTVAGTGYRGRGPDHSDRATAVSLDHPTNLALDAAGSVYIADTRNGLVRRLDPSGELHTVAGGGSEACPADPVLVEHLGLTRPRGMAVGGDGTMFVTDGDIMTSCVVRIGPSGMAVTVIGQGYPGFAGDGQHPERAMLNHPAGLFLRDDDLYVADRANGRLRRADIDFTASAAQAPCPPRAVRVETHGSNRYALVSWEPPDADGGRPILEYRIVDESTGQNAGTADQGHHDSIYLFDLHPRVFAVSVITNAGESPPVRSAPFSPGQPTPTPPSSGICSQEPPGPGTGPGGSTGSQPLPNGTPPAGSSSGAAGYWMLTADGIVHGFGTAANLGGVRGTMAGGRSAVDLEPTVSGRGYWIADDGGAVYGFGDARYLGGGPSLRSNERVTSLSATPSSQGYRLFTSLGRVFAYGDATLLGDMGNTRLNGPILDTMTTPNGAGYYMVGSDGGVFSFGDSRFRGSMGGQRLNAPVQSLVPDPDSNGYWLVASDGGVFAFDAPFRGSMGSIRLNRPITGMIPYGNGYLMVAEDGGIFNFSDGPFLGSLGGSPPTSPVVAVAAS